MVDPVPLHPVDPALSISGLTVAYGSNPVVASVSVRFQRGAMTAIVGPNGAGKSTLLKAALGLLPRVTGEVTAFGQPVARMMHRIAYVPQRAVVDWDFPARAIDVVLMGMYRQTGLLGRIGLTIIVRVLGLILCAMAVQFIIVGVSDVARGGIIKSDVLAPYAAEK